MRRTQSFVIALLSAVVIAASIAGCEEAKPVTNPNPGAKRDEIQKKTQSGIPGKPTGPVKAH